MPEFKVGDKVEFGINEAGFPVCDLKNDFSDTYSKMQIGTVIEVQESMIVTQHTLFDLPDGKVVFWMWPLENHKDYPSEPSKYFIRLVNDESSTIIDNNDYSNYTFRKDNPFGCTCGCLTGFHSGWCWALDPRNPVNQKQ